MTEQSALQKVTTNKRTFSFADQLAFWFAAVSIPAAWYYGALMAGWAGIYGAFILIFIVSTISLIPWAYLGKIAYQTGGSSMSIVRPAFGIRGAVVPSIFYLVFGMGWAIVNAFLGAIALSFIFKALIGLPSYLDPNNLSSMILYILIVCTLQGLFAVRGSIAIKKLHWAATVFFVLLGLYMTWVVLSHWNALSLLSWQPQTQLTATIGPLVLPLTFAVLVDLLIAYNWTWEFIGDFSRFAKTKNAGTWAPFWGANLAQYWQFTVGAIAVVFLAITTGAYNPLLADPSSTAVSLGLGWIAAFVVLFATIAANSANIYASALGISNMLPAKRQVPMAKLLLVCAVAVGPLALTPLLSPSFVGFYIFFLDFVGAIVVPLWTLTLVDYFLVHKQHYSDDMYKDKGGAYWYTNGWNRPAVITLLGGVVVYWITAYVFPAFRETYTATLPTVAFVMVIYYLASKVVAPAKQLSK